MHLHWLEYVFWLLSPALQIVIAVVMIKRNLRRSYPIFFNYTIFQIISHLAMFVFWKMSYAYYYYAYWTASAIGILIGFFVIREIFLEAFRPYAALRELGEMLFSWSLLVLVLIALVSAFSQSSPDDGRIFIALYTGERSVRILQCGVVLFMFIFARYLGVSAKHQLFGIALGFGLFGAVEMMAIFLWKQYGLISDFWLRSIVSGAYVTAALVWLGYSLAPVPTRRTEILPQSERWNHALAGVLQIPEPDSFLSSIDHTVERLLDKQKYV
jgi:hypothetical protein